MKIPSKRSIKKMDEAYGLSNRLMWIFDEIDDDCAGFDEFSDAYRCMESVQFLLYHTIYVARERHKEQANERNS